jgi:putative methionine-R-sulfoxide reductase with GAF domain
MENPHFFYNIKQSSGRSAGICREVLTVEKQSGDKEKSYQLLLKQLEAMTEDETDAIANYANASALLYQAIRCTSPLE